MRESSKSSLGEHRGSDWVLATIARRAGEDRRRYRRSRASIGLGDYLVAGTASVRGLGLATLDVRHYPMFGGLRPAFGSHEAPKPEP